MFLVSVVLLFRSFLCFLLALLVQVSLWGSFVMCMWCNRVGQEYTGGRVLVVWRKGRHMAWWVRTYSVMFLFLFQISTRWE
ncbi:hypothetical protein V8F33_001753 [Rhypophila sp. PSN 637]